MLGAEHALLLTIPPGCLRDKHGTAAEHQGPTGPVQPIFSRGSTAALRSPDLPTPTKPCYPLAPAVSHARLHH